MIGLSSRQADRLRAIPCHGVFQAHHLSVSLYTINGQAWEAAHSISPYPRSSYVATYLCDDLSISQLVVNLSESDSQANARSRIVLLNKPQGV